MQYLFSFIVSLVIAMLMVPPLIKMAPKLGLVDVPDTRKVHKTVIPRIGGVAMIIGAIVPIVFWLPLDSESIFLLLAFSIILVFGVWDDRSNINYKYKFLGQILAVIIVVFWGGVVVYRVPFLDYDLPAVIAVPFTIFALVGITNAINLSDGLDGLAGGTMLLTLSMIAFLSYQAGDASSLLMSLSVTGAILGFLRHNTYPARVFMGDTGSQFLGFSVGVLVILLSQKVNTAMSPMVPLILLGLPILDTFAVIAQRIYEKRSPFSPDKNHIHHKLLDIGFDHYEAVFIIYLLQTAFISVAYFLRYESDLLIFIIYLLISGLALYLFHFARSRGWKMQKDHSQLVFIKNLVVWERGEGIIEQSALYFLKIGIIVYFIASILLADSINQDISMLSLLLVAFLIASSYVKTNHFEKIVVYVMCVLSVFLMETSQLATKEYHYIIIIFIALIGLAFALKIRFSRDRSFQITPLDFLVVLLVLVVPNMPEFTGTDIQVGSAAFSLIVLFYACEAVLNMIARKWDIFRLGLISGLVLVVIRGFV